MEPHSTRCNTASTQPLQKGLEKPGWISSAKRSAVSASTSNYTFIADRLTSYRSPTRLLQLSREASPRAFISPALHREEGAPSARLSRESNAVSAKDMRPAHSSVSANTGDALCRRCSRDPSTPGASGRLEASLVEGRTGSSRLVRLTGLFSNCIPPVRETPLVSALHCSAPQTRKRLDVSITDRTQRRSLVSPEVTLLLRNASSRCRYRTPSPRSHQKYGHYKDSDTTSPVPVAVTSRYGRCSSVAGLTAKSFPTKEDVTASRDTIRLNPSIPRTLGLKTFHIRTFQRDPGSLVPCLLVCPTRPRISYIVAKLVQQAIHGVVFLASEVATHARRSSPRHVAMKIMIRRPVDRQCTRAHHENVYAAVKFQSTMAGHPNLLPAEYCWSTAECVFVVMPYAEFEDLFEVLKKRSSPFSEPEARWLFRQILSAGQYLHDHNIAFQDHSLENVLMFRSNNCVIPRITDPGQAVHFYRDAYGKPKPMPTGTLFGKSFRPPELYYQSRYDPVKVDVFCLGWMLFFTVTKRQLFDATVETDLNWKSWSQLDGCADIWHQRGASHLTSSLKGLLRSMLNPNPLKRPLLNQCLKHPWFQDVLVPLQVNSIWGTGRSNKNAHHSYTRDVKL